MKTRSLYLAAGAVAALSLAAAAMMPSLVQGAAPALPRTPWGDPDLQGLWTNATMTPLSRPQDLADKEFFTPEEATAFVAAMAKAREDNAGTRAYDEEFNETGPLVKSGRTSLVIDPKDGRVPPFTAEAQKRFAALQEREKLHPADGPEDRWLTERCLLWGAAGPGMLPEPYNSQYLIVQSKGYVAIAVEQGHAVRIIPLIDKPSLPEGERTWLGDSRGHWEGDTLVVESGNMRFADRSRWAIAVGTLADGNLHVVERFTRTDADTIMYQATIEDPTIFTSPWTIEYNFHPAKGPFLEVACHEGNYGLVEILSGARAEEKRK